jgi:hypothetical protein
MANFLRGTILFNIILSEISLIVLPKDELGFARDDVSIMTDETPWNLPTKDNIVSPPCEILP